MKIKQTFEKNKNMTIALTMEEYFDNEICMNCYTVIDFPITFYLPENQVIILCESCSFGMYQCARCHHIVSHLEDTIHREMVYTGPDGTFEDFFIRCRECANTTLQNIEIIADTDVDTDSEEETDLCHVDEETQIMC